MVPAAARLLAANFVKAEKFLISLPFLKGKSMKTIIYGLISGLFMGATLEILLPSKLIMTYLELMGILL